jgi:hypothetical protein
MVRAMRCGGDETALTNLFSGFYGGMGAPNRCFSCLQKMLGFIPRKMASLEWGNPGNP